MGRRKYKMFRVCKGLLPRPGIEPGLEGHTKQSKSQQLIVNDSNVFGARVFVALCSFSPPFVTLTAKTGPKWIAFDPAALSPCAAGRSMGRG